MSNKTQENIVDDNWMLLDKSNYGNGCYDNLTTHITMETVAKEHIPR